MSQREVEFCGGGRRSLGQALARMRHGIYGDAADGQDFLAALWEGSIGFGSEERQTDDYLRLQRGEKIRVVRS
jgi:hypothetical protein